MALNTQETEFLNNVDKVLAKNFSHLKDQFNAILDEKSTQSLLEIAQNLHATQSQLLYYQIFIFLVVIIAVWYCYQILTGRFVEHLYTNISNQMIQKNEEVLKEQEKRYLKLEAMFQYQFKLVKETQASLENQNQLTARSLHALSSYEQKLFNLVQENERLQAELFKTQNILRKKIKKGGIQNEGQSSQYS